MREHIESELPKPGVKARDRAATRVNIAGALEQAKAHLECVRHNPRAVKIQEKIIERYESQLRDLNEQEWLGI